MGSSLQTHLVKGIEESQQGLYALSPFFSPLCSGFDVLAAVLSKDLAPGAAVLIPGFLLRGCSKVLS